MLSQIVQQTRRESFMTPKKLVSVFSYFLTFCCSRFNTAERNAFTGQSWN